MVRMLAEIFLMILVTMAIVVGVSFGMARWEGAPPEPVEPIISESGQAETVISETIVPVEPAPNETEEIVSAIDAIPRYYQTDYPYDKFGNGTISTSGCSVTCLAMVATYLTDRVYMPDELAYAFKNYGKNNIERLEYGNTQMKLPNVRTDNARDVFRALKEGKVAIAMMDGESVFTSTQHFIVLAGMTEDGTIMVNDPLGQSHAEDVYLQNGYANGFGEHDILRGFSGAWIYDKSDMQGNSFVFTVEKPEQKENRYQGYELTDEDIYILASFAWAEARNESEEVQQAVLEVLLNRVVSPEFPNTVRDVIYQGEFYDRTEKMQNAQVDFPQYRAVTAAMYGPYVLPEDVYYFSVWETRGESWGKLGSFTFLYSR